MLSTPAWLARLSAKTTVLQLRAYMARTSLRIVYMNLGYKLSGHTRRPFQPR